MISPTLLDSLYGGISLELCYGEDTNDLIRRKAQTNRNAHPFPIEVGEYHSLKRDISEKEE